MTTVDEACALSWIQVLFASDMSDDHEIASEMDSDTLNYDTEKKRSEAVIVTWKQKALALKRFDQTVLKMKHCLSWLIGAK